MFCRAVLFVVGDRCGNITQKASFALLETNFANDSASMLSASDVLAILIFYLVNILQYPQNTASSIFHSFNFFYSFTPVLGSILADGFIGKYHTILWISLFYSFGGILLATAAAFRNSSPIHPYLDFVGLFIIGLGSGGIKPCVSPFGGDQFDKNNAKALAIYFSMFYFTVNAGGFISGIVTPLFRVHPCLGMDTCYTLAFGFPAIFMVFSCVIFAVGTPFYKRYPPKGAQLLDMFRVIYIAIRNKQKGAKKKRKNWLEYYLDTHDCKLDSTCTMTSPCQKVIMLNDIQGVFRVLVMFIPIPMYFAVYSLKGDRWALQASEMNGKFGNFVILPDQMGVFNTVLVLTFIPIFQSAVYPLISKSCKVTPLRKMSVGGFLSVIACFMAALLQMKINTTLPTVPAKNTAFFTVLNYATCPVCVTSVNATSETFVVNSSEASETITISAVTSDNEIFDWSVNRRCASNTSFTAEISDRSSTYAILTDDHVGWMYADLEKSTQGEGLFKISVNYFADNEHVLINNNTVQMAWCQSDVSTTNADPGTCNSKKANLYSEFTGTLYGGSVFVELLPKKWHLYIQYTDGVYHNSNITYTQYNQGGIYTLTVLNGNFTNFISQVHQIAPDNTINIMWIMPQLVVITISEVLFSVTGMEFSFTQAPSSMKSVIMAFWVLNDAFGQIIVLIVNSFNFTNVANLFFVFSIMLFLAMIGFVLLSVFYYKYVEIDQ